MNAEMYEAKIKELEEIIHDLKVEIECQHEVIEELKKQIPKKLSNLKQQRRSQYLEKMPENVIQIDKYGGLRFDRYYFDVEGERLIMITSSGKIKIVSDSNQTRKTVTLISIGGELKSICYPKFLKQFKSE